MGLDIRQLGDTETGQLAHPPEPAVRIPLCLVTGFLGSGKTSYLKHIVAQNTSRKLVYVVNEFSPQDIDGALVSAENPNVVSIPGGSIFCRCLAGEFIGTFTSIPEAIPSLEGIVVEASGMADPRVIKDMLKDARLDERYEITKIVSVVDPASFRKLRVTLAAITAQIEAADAVLINKRDLHDAATLEETMEGVCEINPDAEIHACSFGQVDLDIFSSGGSERELHGEFAKCKDPNYESVTAWPTRDIPPLELARRLEAAADDVYRAKGFVNWRGTTVQFDYSASGFFSRTAQRQTEPAAVLIMKNDASPAGRDLAAWLSGTN